MVLNFRWTYGAVYSSGETIPGGSTSRFSTSPRKQASVCLSFRVVLFLSEHEACRQSYFIPVLLALNNPEIFVHYIGGNSANTYLTIAGAAFSLNLLIGFMLSPVLCYNGQCEHALI